jgi:hypothetical protein
MHEIKLKEKTLISKCANPDCGKPFRYFRGGKLFIRETSGPMVKTMDGQEKASHRLEHFWLCEQCSSKMTVTVDSSGSRASARTRPPASVGAGLAVKVAQ